MRFYDEPWFAKIKGYSTEKRLVEVDLVSGHDLIAEAASHGWDLGWRAVFCPPEPPFPTVVGQATPDLGIGPIFWDGQPTSIDLVYDPPGNRTYHFEPNTKPKPRSDGRFHYAVFLEVVHSLHPLQSWDLAERKRDICLTVIYPGDGLFVRQSVTARISGEAIASIL